MNFWIFSTSRANARAICLISIEMWRNGRWKSSILLNCRIQNVEEDKILKKTHTHFQKCALCSNYRAYYKAKKACIITKLAFFILGIYRSSSKTQGHGQIPELSKRSGDSELCCLALVFTWPRIGLCDPLWRWRD